MLHIYQQRLLFFFCCILLSAIRPSQCRQDRMVRLQRAQASGYMRIPSAGPAFRNSACSWKDGRLSKEDLQRAVMDAVMDNVDALQWTHKNGRAQPRRRKRLCENWAHGRCNHFANDEGQGYTSCCGKCEEGGLTPQCHARQRRQMGELVTYQQL